MKYGVREICDVVLRAKGAQKVGNKIFYKNEPVIYFDTLKTSSLEGSAATVYAQGGRGNARLVAWEGERTITFTMEDALISPEGFMILSGAGLVDSTEKVIYQHVTETIDAQEEGIVVAADSITIPVSKKPYMGKIDKKTGEFVPEKQNLAYVMLMKDGEIVSEPYVPENADIEKDEETGKYFIKIEQDHKINEDPNKKEAGEHAQTYSFEETFESFDSILVDYYVAHDSDGSQQIEITADKFGGNYYLEASTLWRNEQGIDMPAEFIIPNCKIQSNFNFNMASSGDPSTFTFTMDAFPDYTRFDHSKKVLAEIQVIKDDQKLDLHRHSTKHELAHEELIKF